MTNKLTNKMQNTRLAHALVSKAPNFKADGITGQPIALATCQLNKLSTRERTRVVCVLDYEKTLPQVECTETFSGLDKAVMDAIYTIWSQRKDQSKDTCDISYNQIYRVMHGSDAARIGKTAIEKIKMTIRKLRSIDVRIQYGEDTNRVREYFKHKGIKALSIRGHAIVADEVDITLANGLVACGIRLYRCPIMWEYALAQQQIISVDPKMLAIPDCNMTDRFTSVRNYLITYLTARSKGHIKNDTVHYEAILNNAGFEVGTSRKAQYADRQMIKNILNYYMTIGCIKEYTESKDCKSVRIVME